MTENTNNNIANEYNALWVMLAQAKNTIAKARQRDSAQLNITDERRRVLWSIQNNDGQATPVEISHQLLLELHSVTAMLNRMEKEGLIEKLKGQGIHILEETVVSGGRRVCFFEGPDGVQLEFIEMKGTA